MLVGQINYRLHRRIDFADHLPDEDGDLARQLARDPHLVDFLDLIGRRVAERELDASRRERGER